ncbi:hypothetical protein [Antrihabitans cavernicola]|uniref:Uncharacterized protein n=1 Tax=Antrihabitans cavernicola TaxID=2495913 RepID=A0A5A7S8U4_9NOCA|nr:hypothetical protein [Spelaeibacter cavernicola]KAA0022560.1 hypothetical protein FOY51_12750 [Spelaeibacter cavernicola]
MSAQGRRAMLPNHGYAPPQRHDPLGESRFRVVFYPERGGRPTELDLSDLPVPDPMRGWLVAALAKGTGPSGSARTLDSARTLLGAARSFARYLGSLDRPPPTPAHLRGTHWDGYVLAQRVSNRRAQVINLRSLLRHASDVPVDFAARMHRTQVSRDQQKFQAYSAAEYTRVTAAAKTHLRECVRRIHGGRALLTRWRAGEIDRGHDRDGWERGWLLDHIDRHDEVPRYPCGSRHQISSAHGGTAVLFAQLYPTPHDLAAAAALLICLTGHNLSTIRNLPARHHRPDGDAGASRTAIVGAIKPRRGRQHAHMSIPLHEPARADPVRLDLSSAYAVYQVIHDICGPVRARAGTDLLFAYFTPKGGMLFLPGLRRNVIAEWARTSGLLGDTVDEAGQLVPLRLDSRRLRMNWLELHQQPVAHTEQTLANDYLGRHRGNLAEYQQIVATTLGEQVDEARRTAAMRTLTTEQVEQARTDPDTVAAQTGLTTQVLTDLLRGRLDTIVAGCVDNTHSPHAAAGQPCTASFLLCLSCPCARATPQHLPIITEVHDRLQRKSQEMTPLRWAQRFAGPLAQLADVMSRYPDTIVSEARTQVTQEQRELVTRFLARSLDVR